jgi:hypothetical protein
MTVLAIDCETFLIQRDRPFPPVVSLAWAEGSRNAVLPHTSAEVWIAGVLSDPTQRLCGHNIAYDHCTLAASYPALLPAIFDAYKAGRITDTQLRQQLIMIACKHIVGDDAAVRGHSLAGLYQDCFDEPIPGPGGNKGSVTETPDHVRYTYGSLYGVDFADWSDEHVEYARQDPIATLRIHDLQQEKAGDLLRDDAFQAYSAFVLSLISANGMRTDPGRVAALKARETAAADALQPELVAEGLLEPRYGLVRDGKPQIGWTLKQEPARARIEAACLAKGLEPIMTKPKNPKAEPQISFERSACVWAEDPVMLRRADYVSHQKILGTYIPALEQGYELPITSRYGLAATGRTTASAPSLPLVGTNLQNAPRREGVRECYIPREGKLLMAADFEGAEMHTLAQVCLQRVGYSVLGDTLNAGRDAHINTARYLLGGARTPLDYDDLALRVKQGDPEAKLARQDAKPVNFGFGGFMHEKTFVHTQLKEGKRWSLQDAHDAREAWLTAYDEMPLYFESCKLELGAHRKCVVELGWYKRLRMVRGMPTICNGFFQALTADGAKKAVNEVVRVCLCEPDSALARNNTYGVNFVHDELITETDDSDVDTLQEVAREFGDIMTREFNELVPDYPTSVEVVFARYWSKAMRPVFDSAERLVPWNG